MCATCYPVGVGRKAGTLAGEKYLVRYVCYAHTHLSKCVAFIVCTLDKVQDHSIPFKILSTLPPPQHIVKQSSNELVEKNIDIYTFCNRPRKDSEASI